MDYVYIEQLIDRYFEAATTIEEERILRAFFSQRDVPQHLRRYAPIFLMEAGEIAEKPRLDEHFDRKIMARLEAEGLAPEVHVTAVKMTFADRIRPLWRAAAAVAIVVLVGTAAFEATDRSNNAPVGVALEHQHKADSAQLETTPYRQLQNGMKMAVTIDSAQNNTLLSIKTPRRSPRFQFSLFPLLSTRTNEHIGK